MRLERSWRATSAMTSKLSARAGRVMWASQGPIPCSAGMYPAEGNSPSPTARIATSTMPTTNAGITEITVTNPVIARSIGVVRRSAATVPRRKPTSTPMTRAKVATERLTPRPRPMRVEMSAPLTQLVPSSPCRTPVNQSQYWARKGLSSPHSASMRPMASGVASSPNWMRAGLSPLSERSTKVTKVATRKTGTKMATDRARTARTRALACRVLATATPRRRAEVTCGSVVVMGLPPLCAMGEWADGWMCGWTVGRCWRQ